MAYDIIQIPKNTDNMPLIVVAHEYSTIASHQHVKGLLCIVTECLQQSITWSTHSSPEDYCCSGTMVAMIWHSWGSSQENVWRKTFMSEVMEHECTFSPKVNLLSLLCLISVVLICRGNFWAVSGGRADRRAAIGRSSVAGQSWQTTQDVQNMDTSKISKTKMTLIITNLPAFAL